MGLISRQLEESGIPTVVMTSARDVTEAVNPPRAVFLDYPLGHTAGRPLEVSLGREIVAAALDAFHDADRPGWIRDLPFRWDTTDQWKDAVLRPTEGEGIDRAPIDDDRAPRSDTPQYQSADDAAAAQKSHIGNHDAVRKGVDY